MAKNNAGNSDKKLVSRREFLAGSGAVIAAIALASCSQKTVTSISTTSQPTSTIPTVTTTTPTGTPTLTPKYGGTLRSIQAGTSQANIGWPPEIAQSPMNSAINQECCETLLRGDKTGNVYPWLAESYKVADDLKSITFNLRKGVKFHDGSDFNAEVAKWNLEQYLSIPTYGSWKSVDKIDDYTIRVNFTDWMITLPMSFAEGNPVAPMVSKAAFEKNGLEWMRANPVGTGPFKFGSHHLGDRLKWVRNPDYWVKGKPYLDGLEYIYVADSTTQQMAMQYGDGDMTPNLAGGKAAHDYAALGFKVQFFMGDNQILIPDTANPDSPWANQKVREAVEYAIDREEIAKGLGYGYWQALYQVPPRDSVAYDPNFTAGRKYDPEKAKQLLAEADYADGFNTTIHVAPFDSYRDPIVAVQSDLAKVGIQAELNFLQMGTWSTYGGSGKWPKGTVLCNPLQRMDSSFIGGIQFMFNMTGQSWLRTPELLQAYHAVMSSPAVDIKLIRAVTDIITKDASMIPICESGSAIASQSYVVASFNERDFMAFYNSEDFWLNK